MRAVGWLIFCGVLFAAGSLSCSGVPGAEGNASTGDVGLLLVFGSFRVNSAHYVLISGKSSYAGDLQVNGGDTLSARINGVVAASGYHLAVTAEAPDGSFRCEGGARFFAVPKGETVSIALDFECVAAREERPPSPPNWEVNECPDITSVVADPAEGCSIRLHVNANDVDQKPQALGFWWSNGSTGPTPVLGCQVEGPVNLVVTVSDGDSAPGCDATFELKVICPVGCSANQDGSVQSGDSYASPGSDRGDASRMDGGISADATSD